jgi:catechol 2,3-dioxygenase-like lactoylglutathione lyase family enzyme
MDDLTLRRGHDAMTRRSALLGLAATMVSPCVMAQQAKPVIATRRLNNVMISVSNLDRSTAFYEKMFGPSVRQGDAVVFRVGEGPHFFALRAARSGENPDFLSYGMTVADFDAERVMRALADHGVGGAQITRRGDTPELFVADPNGIKLQLQHTAYGYGSGARGDMLPPAPKATAKPVFQPKSINHVTLTIANGPREMAFYQTVFGLPVRAMQGDGVTLAIGEGTDRLQPQDQQSQRHVRRQSRLLHDREFRRRASHGNPDRQRSRPDRDRDSRTRQAFDVPRAMASTRQ